TRRSSDLSDSLPCAEAPAPPTVGRGFPSRLFTQLGPRQPLVPACGEFALRFQCRCVAVGAHVERPGNATVEGPVPCHFRGHRAPLIDAAYSPLAAIDRVVLPLIYGTPEPGRAH